MHRNVEENEICIVFDFRLGFIFIDLVISIAKLKRDCLCRTRLRSNGTTTTSLSLYESRWQRTPPPHGGSLISDNSAQYHPHTSGVQSPQSRWTCWHFRTTTITTIAPHPLPPFRLPRQLLSKCSSRLVSIIIWYFILSWYPEFLFFSIGIDGLKSFSSATYFNSSLLTTISRFI